MSKQAIKNVAKVKNPKDEVWYVKSLYFAYLVMEKYSLFNKAVYVGRATKYNKKELLNKITQAEDKVSQRQIEGEKIEKEKRKEKENQNRQTRNTSHDVKKSNIVKTSTVSKVSNFSKKSKTTKIIGKK